MEIKDLKEHCEQQMKRLPRGSKMYEEHLLTLAIIETNKKYVDEIDKLNKIIDLMTEYIINSKNEEGICLKVEDSCSDYAGQNGKTCDTCIKQYFERKAEES